MDSIIVLNNFETDNIVPLFCVKVQKHEIEPCNFTRSDVAVQLKTVTLNMQCNITNENNNETIIKFYFFIDWDS